MKNKTNSIPVAVVMVFRSISSVSFVYENEQQTRQKLKERRK